MNKKNKPTDSTKDKSTPPRESTEESRANAKESVTRRWEEFIANKPLPESQRTREALTREGFFRALEKVSRPAPSRHGKGKSKTSE